MSGSGAPLIAHFAISGIPAADGWPAPTLPSHKGAPSKALPGLEVLNLFITTGCDPRHRHPTPRVRKCPQIGAARSVPVSPDGQRNCPKPIFSALGGAKSLFRNILTISPLNSKILSVLPCNSVIPKRPGGGG